MYNYNEDKIRGLRNYFVQREDIAFAFLFGSQAKENSSQISDWDIALYLKPVKNVLEWEEEKYFPQEEAIWNELIDLLKTDNVDMVVLNRVPSNICASVLRSGIPLTIKDYRLYWDFLLVTLHQAEDYREFVDRYYEISQEAKSLSPEEKERIKKIVSFEDP